MDRRNSSESENIEVPEAVSVKDRKKFYEALEEHKKETKKDFDEHKREATRKIERVEDRFDEHRREIKQETDKHKDETKKEIDETKKAIEDHKKEVVKRFELIDARQTAFDNRQNGFDDRLTLTEQNFRILNDKMTTLAKQVIAADKSLKIINPNEGEEKDLKDLLGEEAYKILKKNADIVTAKKLSEAMGEALKKTLESAKIVNDIKKEERDEEKKKNTKKREEENEEMKERHKLEIKEIEKAQREQARALELEEAARTRQSNEVNELKARHALAENQERAREELETSQAQEIKSEADLHKDDAKNLKSGFVSAIETVCKYKLAINIVGEVAIEAVKLAIDIAKALSEYIKENQAEEREDNRLKNKADKLEVELIAMTTNERKETFEKANVTYLARYYATYDREDISYNEDSYKYFSSILDFKEFFSWQGLLGEKIEDYKEKLKIISTEELPKCYENYLQFIKQKDYLSFVKNDKKEDFKVKYKLYRACLKLGEFYEIKNCGDKNEVRRAICCTVFTIISGAGIIFAAGFGTERGSNEYYWHQNIPNLKSRVEFYNDWTKSEYGKSFLEKNKKALSAEFTNEEAEKKFDKCFDLLQKISHTGIADRENYVIQGFKFKSFEQLQVQAQALTATTIE